MDSEPRSIQERPPQPYPHLQAHGCACCNRYLYSHHVPCLSPGSAPAGRFDSAILSIILVQGVQQSRRATSTLQNGLSSVQSQEKGKSRCRSCLMAGGRQPAPGLVRGFHEEIGRHAACSLALEHSNARLLTTFSTEIKADGEKKCVAHRPRLCLFAFLLCFRFYLHFSCRGEENHVVFAGNSAASALSARSTISRSLSMTST